MNQVLKGSSILHTRRGAETPSCFSQQLPRQGNAYILISMRIDGIFFIDIIFLRSSRPVQSLYTRPSTFLVNVCSAKLLIAMPCATNRRLVVWTVFRSQVCCAFVMLLCSSVVVEGVLSSLFIGSFASLGLRIFSFVRCLSVYIWSALSFESCRAKDSSWVKLFAVFAGCIDECLGEVKMPCAFFMLVPHQKRLFMLG